MTNADELIQRLLHPAWEGQSKRSGVFRLEPILADVAWPEPVLAVEQTIKDMAEAADAIRLLGRVRFAARGGNAPNDNVVLLRTLADCFEQGKHVGEVIHNAPRLLRERADLLEAALDVPRETKDAP